MFSFYYRHLYSRGFFKPNILIVGLLGICWLLLEVTFFLLKKDLGPTPLFKAHIISCLIFFCFALTFQNPLFAKSAYFGMLIGVVLSVLLCLIQVFWATFLTDWPPPRSPGFSGNPNAAAFAITFGFFAVIWHIPKKYRIYFATFCLAGIIATMSRTLFVAFITGVILLMAFKLFQVTAWRKQCGIAICLLSSFFIIAYEVNPIFRFGIDGQFLNIPKSLSFYASTGSHQVEIAKAPAYRDYDKLSLTVRLDEMKRGVAKLSETPLQGMRDLDQASEDSGHNAYLYYRLSYGIIGYIIIPIFLLIITVPSKRRIAIPFGAALMIAALGYQDILSSWGSLIMPSAFILAFQNDK